MSPNPGSSVALPSIDVTSPITNNVPNQDALPMVIPYPIGCNSSSITGANLQSNPTRKRTRDSLTGPYPSMVPPAQSPHAPPHNSEQIQYTPAAFFHRWIRESDISDTAQGQPPVSDHPLAPPPFPLPVAQPNDATGPDSPSSQTTQTEAFRNYYVYPLALSAQPPVFFYAQNARTVSTAAKYVKSHTGYGYTRTHAQHTTSLKGLDLWE